MLGIDGGHNIDIDPLFVDPLGSDNLAGIIDDNLRLMPNSPVINSGDNSSVPVDMTTDLDGLPRSVCGSVDMGAYENQSPQLKIHNITQDRFYCRIQDCIDAAVNADECIVPPGTYFETINFLGKAITLRSSHGPASTIIDAAGVADDDNGVSVVTCISGETATTVLNGFTITGGKTGTNNSTEKTGSGMFNDGTSPTVTNCIFAGNVADEGGGMRNSNSASPTVTNSTFGNNTATRGGGMHNRDFSSPTVTNCLFYENDGGIYGGAMLNIAFSSPTITKCMYRGNTAGSGGGLGNFDSSNPVIANCLFSGNMASRGSGGAIGNYDSSPNVINCTLSNNTASIRGGGGGGIRNIDNSNPKLTNCILRRNSPNEIINAASSTPTIAYCNIEGSGGSTTWDTLLGADGGGNIDVDPLFIDPLGLDGIVGTDDDDIRLSLLSPCIDAADYDAYLNTGGGLTDLDGKDRIIDDTSIVDTGVGAITYLDMGAYEAGLCHADGIYDYSDFSNLNECLTGPASSLNLGCACVDLDFDEQIGLRDFAQFQLAFNP